MMVDMWGSNSFDPPKCPISGEVDDTFACDINTHGWHHVAVTYDGHQNHDSMKGYYDGEKTHQGRPAYIVLNADGNNFQFANFPTEPAPPGTCVTLDDVAISDIAF